MIVALLPHGTNTGDIAKVPGFSPGLWSAGLSTVPVFQTYLDISQGNRIFTSLYPGEDIEDVVAGPRRVESWPAIVKRAEDAPSDTVPGLLAQTLEDAGVRVRVDPLLNAAALIGANRAGIVDRRGSFDCAKRRCPPGVTVVPALPGELAGLRRRLRGNDLLIALERPPTVDRESLAIGIAGRGFDGNLTSDNTRTNGFVTAPDLAPTILERFGLGTPSQMIGKPIHTEGSPDVGAINKLEDRLSVVASRRHEVIMINVLSWIALAAGAIAIGRRRGARVALPLLGLSVIYMPLMLLATAGLEPSRLTERLAVGLGSPLLALATWAVFRGYAALAIACAVTVGAYAIDMIFGSPLTQLDLLGPNPAIGVRFFGIGNELEATFAVLVPAGVGAGLAAWGWRGGEEAVRRRAIAAFAGVGALTGLIFGLGRFGADVGAVIVLPAGAAVAAAVAAGTGGRRRTVLLIVAAPVLALTILAALDLILGGGAHLTSSVLRAGGASGVADVAQRRIELSVKSFGRAATSPYLYITAVAMALAILYRRRLAELLGNRLVFAGVCGAAAATVLGTVANDSGAVLLMIGTGFLLACGAFLIGVEGER
ncbi:MAG: hypothetical protein QOD60_1302 [Solirubrobacterales bacterium]|nr:hypothetical protein [Solirubrobacterales bacterium]